VTGAEGLLASREEPPAPVRPGQAGEPRPLDAVDWTSGLPILHGSRLSLREPCVEDAEFLFEMLATPDVGRFMNRPPNRPEAFERFIEWARRQRRLGRNFCYGIVPDGYDRPVGLIQVRPIESGFASAEWGFAIGQPFWGQDVFASAARIVIDFIFRHTGAHRLEARTAIQNGRANGALKKVGATPEGVLRESFIVDGKPVHQVLWSMRSEEWLSNAPTPYRVEIVPEDAESVAGPGPDSLVGPSPGWCLQMPELRTAGVRLRELVHADAEPLVRLVATPDVGRYMQAPPDTAAGFRQFIAWGHAQRAAGQFACLGVVPDACDHAVGIFQLHRVDQTFSIAEWGFALGRPYWGTGLFGRGARLFLDFAFDTVGVRRLEARAAQANVRANAALRKLGAAREGAMKRSFLLGGEYHDDYLWSLLAEDRFA